MHPSYQPICSWCVLPPLLPTQQVVVLPDSSPTATLRALVVIVSDVRPQDAGNRTPPTTLPAPFTNPRSAVCHDVTLYTLRPNLDLQGRRRGMGDRDSGVGWGGGGVTLDWGGTSGRCPRGDKCGRGHPSPPLPAPSTHPRRPQTSPAVPRDLMRPESLTGPRETPSHSVINHPHALQHATRLPRLAPRWRKKKKDVKKKKKTTGPMLLQKA